jgi:hypothetical protein
MNYKRERQYMAKLLSEKGASLIRAFKAGAQTGMRTAHSENNVQKTTKRPYPP